MKKKIIGLIPTRLNSRRLPAKALLPINNIPLIVHVYRRAKLSKNLDEVFIVAMIQNFKSYQEIWSKRNINLKTSY